MAKKKSSKRNVSAPKEFSSSPFKSLKGLSAFKEETPPEKVVPKQGATVADRQTHSEEQISFSEEMDFLGVTPLEGAVLESSSVVKSPHEKGTQPSLQSRDERANAAFLEAMGSMEKSFKEEWPEGESVKQAVPRRMKQVERGQLKLEAELDLHGLTIEEASVKVSFFLQDAIYQGFQSVLIITGKGLHSNEGPVLRQAMENLLGQLSEQVLEWGVAPRRFGGSGALVVFLRQVNVK